MASSVDQKSAASPAASTSASQRADESDLDPATFLKSVRELSEKREREDAERYRKLEEEIERGRQERAARRADRAKSISPVKASATPQRAAKPSKPSKTVDPIPPATPPASTPSTMDPPPSQLAAEDVPEFQGFSRSGSRTKSNTSATQSPAQTQDSSASSTALGRSASSLARSGTLSWQQRPSSRGAGSRPVSMVSLGGSSTTAASTSTSDTEPSRDQIAASLGSRDPSWFRQTADRGVGNAAYRKSKDETTSGESFVSGQRGLPGLSREVSAEPVAPTSPPPSESVASDTASRTGSMRDSAVSSSQFSTNRTSTSSKPDLKALIAEDAEQEKAWSERTSNTDGEQSTLGRTPTMSSSQARLANTSDRPPSPTKGMGGFVQSAMLKRSDSLNKRWSAQPGTSISRQNSAASARGAYGGLTGSHSMPKLEPTLASRESSKEPNSRPTSSSSNLTNLTATQEQSDQGVFVKPALPHSRSKSTISSAEDGQTSPPASPSKRWSPNKSTWLESAITKPDSPKPAPAARNSQPSWMADIAKAKAQRASTDSTPKPVEEQNARPDSPRKAPFGQGMLKRSESRDLGTPRTGTPTLGETARSRSASPTKASLGLGIKDEGAESGFGGKMQTAEVKSSAKTPVLADVESESIGAERLISKPAEKYSAKPAEKPTPKPAEQSASVASQSNRATAPLILDRKSETPSSRSKAPAQSTVTKPKPETPPKPQTDFRSTLRTRMPSEAKQQDAPEFLSRFGNLKKTQTQNYVAPDLLKDNILRGKGDLAKTGGPVKTERRDELKESLLAKKELWKKEKEEGVVHERKVSNPPQTPQKPEALAKRDILGRSESIKSAASPKKPRDATPEALARHKSLNEKPKPEVSLPTLEKQKSEPLEAFAATPPAQPKQPTETSKMAARFNPGLAGILARGPPAVNSGSNTASRSDSPVIIGPSTIQSTRPTEPPADGAQLRDMRKGRAKGPKRRKGGAKDASIEPTEPAEPAQEDAEPLVALPTTEQSKENGQADEKLNVASKPKPRAPPGSAASLMMASLQKTPSSESKPSIPSKSPSIATLKQPADTPAMSLQPKPVDSAPLPQKDIPDFKGFSSNKKPTPSLRQVDDNKENAGEASPSVKSAASMWGKQGSSHKVEPPAQIQLPSKKDEEAAMRSAGLLASSPSRPSSSNGLGIRDVSGSTSRPSTPSHVPAKPAKPSKAVSGQLQEASPNKGSPDQPLSGIEQRLADIFGSVPRSTPRLSIDTHAVLATPCHQERVFRTIRKSVQLIGPDGSLKQLPPQEEYTFFEEDVYICIHAYSVGDSPKKTEIFIWTGDSSTNAAADHAHTHAKKLAKENGNAYVHGIRQGVEPPGFLQALGGILVTRKGSHDHASKQYMLRGRKHLGQIMFDEVDFSMESLCSAFAYLISFPVTLQETKVYLWKGSACSTEEVSGGRLAAMGSIDGVDVIEVDDGAEFASFLKIFGPGTTKASIPKPSQLWQQKALAPNKFTTRLFRIQQADAKTGLFSSMFRRPSWGNKSPARTLDDESKAEAIEISPFAQTDLEADCIYILDAYAELHVLVGPMFPSQPEAVRNVLLAQTLLFASEYAVLAASAEDRPTVPKASILVSGVPPDLKLVFRGWDDGMGLWGTGGLMSGSYAHTHGDVEVLDPNEVLGVACKR